MAAKGIFFGTGGGSVGTESDAVRWTKHWAEKEWQEEEEEEVRDRREDIVGDLKRRRRDDTAMKRVMILQSQSCKLLFLLHNPKQKVSIFIFIKRIEVWLLFAISLEQKLYTDVETRTRSLTIRFK